MQLGALEVRNIRSYRRASLAIPPGTTLLVGDVGSGKTSLLHAIEMALFGPSEVEPSHLVRHRTREAEVALTLAEGPHHWTFRRTFVRRSRRRRDGFESRENSLVKDGVRTTYSATELRRQAIELLGFPDNPNPRARSDVWRWAVYVPQERMREVLHQDASARLQIIRKALGIETYRIAAENAQDVARSVKSTSEERLAESDRLRHWDQEWDEASRTGEECHRRLDGIRRQEADLRSRLEETGRARDRLHAAESELARAAEEAGRIASDRERLQTEVRDIENRSHALSTQGTQLAVEARDLRSNARRLASRTKSLERDRDRRTTVHGAIDAVNQQVAELSSAETALALSERARASAATERDESLRLVSEARAELERFESVTPQGEPTPPTDRDVASLAEELSRLEHDALRQRDRLGALVQEEADLRSLAHSERCPRCGQSVRGAEFLIHLSEVELARANAAREWEEAEAKTRALRGLRDEREQFDRSLSEWKFLSERRASARELVRHAVERANGTGRRAAEVDEELERARATVERLAGARTDRELLVQERATLEERIHKLEGDRAALSTLEVRISAIRNEQAAATSHLADLETQWRRSVQRLRELDHRSAALLERVRERDAVRGRALEAEDAHRRVQSDLDGALGQRIRLESQIQEAARRIQAAELGRSDRARLETEANQLSALGEWLGGAFRQALDELERQVLAHAHAEFDRAFAGFFAALVEDPQLQARSDDAFLPMVDIEGEWTPAEALSGGERTAMALAFRLALGSVVRRAGRLRLETLILDEPTDGFSPEQVLRMGELLDELRPPQLVLVSHEDRLAGFADRVVRVEKREGVSNLVEPPLVYGAELAGRPARSGREPRGPAVVPEGSAATPPPM